MRVRTRIPRHHVGGLVLAAAVSVTPPAASFPPRHLGRLKASLNSRSNPKNFFVKNPLLPKAAEEEEELLIMASGTYIWHHQVCQCTALRLLQT